MKTKVAIVKCGSYEREKVGRAVKEAFGLLGGKVKFPSCEVKFCGNQYDATQYIYEHGGRGAVVGITISGGNNVMLTGGDSATVTGGYFATVTGGHYATVTGGDSATVTGGNRSKLILSYWDTRSRSVVAYVGEDGIESGVSYRLNDKHKFVKAE